MSTAVCQTEPSPWPHRMAMLLVGLTFPLIFIGGLVTTTQAGMAVPDWPTTYGYNMFLYPWQTWLFGPWDLFVEHGHRLLASLVGLVTIGFVAVVFYCDRRRWMHVLSVVALLGVVVQGVLGGMRVLMDARTLAQIHACVGPAFFALAASLAVFCSPRWREALQRRACTAGPKLQRLAIATVVIAYVQLVLGSQLRHIGVAAEPALFRGVLLFHLLFAAILLMHIGLLVSLAQRHFRDESSVRRPVRWLGLLIVSQIMLGGGTWVVKFGWPAIVSQYQWAAAYVVASGSFLQSLTVTAHVAIGSLILALSLVVALRALRFYAGTPSRDAVRHSGRLVGGAA